jgi:beta-glucosidase
MPQATYHFPAGFLWGTATAAHQVEGSNTNNNWSYWEDQPGRILNGDKAGLACDWWGGRWRDDLDRAAEAGQNAHRFSIEWSRIQPEPDRWDEDALDRYREMLRGMHLRNMTPLITLHHFTDPLWLFERGGWENPEAPALFEAFVRRAVDALKEYCTTWVTINEPGVYVAEAYLEGLFPPGKRDPAAAFTVMANLLRGHALAYRAIKSIQREARVGVAHHVRWMEPRRAWLPLDRALSGLAHQAINTAFPDALVDGRLRLLGRSARIPEAIGTQDYFGLNYYTMEQAAFNLLKPRDYFLERSFPKDAVLSDTGFQAHRPQGMFQSIKWATRFNLPILITENGVEDAEDRLRPRYLVEHLHQVWRAIQFNWLVKGYFHWTLVDNFEWERGWTQHFGLWGLDRATQARIRRPSADLYAAICAQNGLATATVEKFAPESVKTLYPD